MATIENIDLVLGRSTKNNLEYAQVTFKVTWAENEIQYEHGFRLKVFLMQINMSPDTVFQSFDGAIGSISLYAEEINEPEGVEGRREGIVVYSDQYDTLIGEITNEQYAPRNIEEELIRSAELEFLGRITNLDTINIKYRAIVSIVPVVPENIGPSVDVSPELSLAGN
jgi:hypothetical protein